MLARGQKALFIVALASRHVAFLAPIVEEQESAEDGADARGKKCNVQSPSRLRGAVFFGDESRRHVYTGVISRKMRVFSTPKLSVCVV